MLNAEQTVRRGLARQFGGEPELTVSAPGRVNLIGEHTDYNGGYVLPVALPLRMWAALRRRGDDRMRMAALDSDERAEALPDQPPPAAGTAHWSDYVRGVAWALSEAGHRLGGFDLALRGEVPVGAGLSSSAALCVAVARGLAALFAPDLSARDLALLAHRAETGFVGLACGVMDQFVAALGDERHALLLDCRSLEYQAVPLPLTAREDPAAEHRVASRGPLLPPAEQEPMPSEPRAPSSRPPLPAAAWDAALVVLDSALPRALAASAYNQRVAECAEAVFGARRALPHRTIDTLRDLTPVDLPALHSALAPTPFRRARHVIGENARVLAAVRALHARDLPALGRLLAASHVSLRDDYVVSTPELDQLVAGASLLPGVYGARLTGAGFGGCVVVLARADAVPALTAMIERYREETGRKGRVVTVMNAPDDERLRQRDGEK